MNINLKPAFIVALVALSTALCWSTTRNPYNNIALQAAIHGSMNELTQALENGADVNVTDANGRTALWWAASRGDEKMVIALLKKGANIHLADRQGHTSLAVARKNGHKTVAAQLLKIEAQEKKEDTGIFSNKVKIGAFFAICIGGLLYYKFGWGAAVADDEHYANNNGRQQENTNDAQRRDRNEHAFNNFNNQHRQAEFDNATRNGDTQTVQRLIDGGININELFDNVQRDTALMGAAEHGHVDVVRILVAHRADVNAINHVGLSALMKAANPGHAEIIRILIDGGAHINAADRHGYTPLMRAAAYGHAQAVQLLLDHGADATLTDLEFKRTALEHAQSGRYNDIVQILQNWEVHNN